MSVQLSRRTMLRGAGVAVGLPFLEQMLPTARVAQAQAGNVRRLIAMFAPSGFGMRNWRIPAGTFELSPTLKPLEPVKNDIMIVTNIDRHVPGGGTSHMTGTCCCFTGTTTVNERVMAPGSISVDQVAAGKIGASTRFPSLQLSGGRQSDTFRSHVSWANESKPMTNEYKPEALFDRLFAGADPNVSAMEGERRRRLKKSILDFVRADAQTLTPKLGRADKVKMDEYLTGLREVEGRLVTAKAPAAISCQGGGRPAPTTDARTQIRNHMDLLVVALQCDLTRVATLMLQPGQSDYVYSFLGVTEGHHQLSHESDNASYPEKRSRVDKWQIEQVAYLLTKMKGVVEPGGGSLLDKSVVFLSSDSTDGHDMKNMPVLLAGKAGGAIRTGRQLPLTTPQPVANLFLSMLAAAGAPVARFGSDGTAPIDLS